MTGLIKSYAITVIPSIYGLKVMRSHAAAIEAEKPMIAFADPIFGGPDADQEEKQVGYRSLPSFYRGSQLDADSLRAVLPQLPGTRIEVETVAESLEVTEDDLNFGKKATETLVKTSKLNDYRIVYFATHGLVAGELDEFGKAKGRAFACINLS